MFELNVFICVIIWCLLFLLMVSMIIIEVMLMMILSRVSVVWN